MTETKTLAAALAMVQAKLPVVTKGSTAKVKSKSGAEYSYSFANLADMAPVVYPLLGEVGLAFVCSPTLRGNSYVLVGRLEHTSGQCRSGIFPLPRDTDPQTLGSALTYGRRYLLGCLTGVVTGDEDDDGGRASSAAKGQQARATQAATSRARTRTQTPAGSPAQPPADDGDRNAAVASLVRVGQALGLSVADLKSRYESDHDAELTAATAADIAAFQAELEAGGTSA